MDRLRIHLTLIVLLLVSGPLTAASARAALVWHWEEHFSDAEKDRLRPWLQQTFNAIEEYAGPLPFDVHVHMHRRDGAREPVPWANTRRKDRQSIYFYVDAGFGPRDFLSDWTAPHEFSHLLLPYLGRDNAWFAEGFASYLQHTIMVEMGVIDVIEAHRRRDAKMRRAVAALRDARAPLPQNMPALRARGAYPTFYWGGAVYFERVDARLHEEGSSLNAVLRRYVDCCRMRRSQRYSLDTLVAQLDAAGQTRVFSEELAEIRRAPGCPERPQQSFAAVADPHVRQGSEAAAHTSPE